MVLHCVDIHVPYLDGRAYQPTPRGLHAVTGARISPPEARGLHTVAGARISLREAQGSLPRGTCAVRLPAAWYGATTTGAGCFTAPPGTPYLIDIALKQRIPRGGLRIVRASIDGREINEQVVLRCG